MENKSAVITGGTSGIGKAVAKNLMNHSVNVVIVGQDNQKGERAAEDLKSKNGNAEFIRCDISDENEVENLFEKVENNYESLDFLFNNAGTEGVMAPVTDFPAEACDKLAQVNIKGTLLCIKHALPLMLENGGTIVNNASFVGTTVPFPNGMMYGATKAAVLSITSTLNAGYGDKGIRAFAVCPWMTETPMIDRLTGGNDEVRSQLKQINPSGSFAKPEDISKVVTEMYLDKKSFNPGEAYLVDAGAKTQKVQIPYQAVSQ
jgi:NAD(P)-dependent dehydrogenase (short-subunit alcohol dehydrogenase family)